MLEVDDAACPGDDRVPHRRSNLGGEGLPVTLLGRLNEVPDRLAVAVHSVEEPHPVHGMAVVAGRLHTLSGSGAGMLKNAGPSLEELHEFVSDSQ